MWVWFSCCHRNPNNMSAAAVSRSPSSLPTKKSVGLTVSQQAAGHVSPRSSLAKHTPLPPITDPSASSTARRPSSGGEDVAEGENPFLMPPESELFTLRERQRRQAKELRAEQRKLKVHEKSTYSSRLNKKNASLRKKVMSPPESASGRMGHREGERGERGVSEDTDFVLTTTRDRHFEKEDITSYVNRKREMFLVQYALGVKRDEIHKLEDIVMAEEQKLEAAENYLKESAIMFDEFVKENDKNASEAVKMAEAATKAKFEKAAEIKQLNAQLVAIKNEISRNNEALTELRECRDFLYRLSPQEWRDQLQHVRRSQPSPEVEEPGEDEERPDDDDGGQDGPCGGADSRLYFTSPEQLLQLFSELEEENLSHIQNSQETEELLEDLRQTRKETERNLDTKIHNLEKQVDLLKRGIELEEGKAADLEMKSKLLSHGEYRADEQEQMLVEIDKKIASVYTKCIGPNEANISSLNMLTAIEGCLEQLFETIESLPADKVEAAEKLKEKERRLRLRAEKMEEQRLYQELKLRRMQERAQAGPLKSRGRRLVYRSEPPVTRKKQTEKTKAQKEKEEEEMLYFFT